jgi:hypothetical protein
VLSLALRRCTGKFIGRSDSHQSDEPPATPAAAAENEAEKIRPRAVSCRRLGSSHEAADTVPKIGYLSLARLTKNHHDGISKNPTESRWLSKAFVQKGMWRALRVLLRHSGMSRGVHLSMAETICSGSHSFLLYWFGRKQSIQRQGWAPRHQLHVRTARETQRRVHLPLPRMRSLPKTYTTAPPFSLRPELYLTICLTV